MNWERAQGSAPEMLESVSTDSRHYPQVRGARSLKAVHDNTVAVSAGCSAVYVLNGRLNSSCGR
jgi:hypothetical protein